MQWIMGLPRSWRKISQMKPNKNYCPSEYEKKRFEQRLQFSRMMRDWKPENFDATTQEMENGNNEHGN